MFSLNIFNNPEPLSIYLVKVDGTIIGSLDNIIDKSSATLNVSLNKQYELNFEIVKRYDDTENWYDYVHEGMYLFVDRVGMFRMNQPTIDNDFLKEKKTIQAFSIDIELESKKFVLPINTGLKTSMEYCVQYDANETEELLNPYTGIPYDWIVIYNTFPEQLNEWKTKLNSISSSGVYGWDIDSENNYYTEDADEIEKVTEFFNLIPRLKNKVNYVDNQDGSKDTVITDYIDITYDSNENIIKYTLFSTIISRIDELIIFYTKYRDQLSILSLALDNMGGSWTVGKVFGVDDGNYTLANKKYQFDELEGTDYAFLTQNLASTSKCIITFDIVNRKVNITPVEEIGEDTGIIIGYDTLVNTLNITTDNDSIATRLYVQGSDDLGITRVNFGTNYVDDLTYRLNVRGNDGKRIYASDELAEKYNTFVTYREQQREAYIELSKEYDEYTKNISEIENRVPNDNLKNDWSTFSLDELKASLTSFKNLLATLQTLYKHDYGEAGLNQDGSINEDFIRNTMYWYDYDAYQKIIVEINCAIDVFPYYSDQTEWTSAQIQRWRDQIKAWETDWSLFGTVELAAKIDIYKQNMELMIEEQETQSQNEPKSIVIRKYDTGYEIKSWNELTDAEKAGYGNSSILYRYNDYMDFYNNSISAQTYLDTLLAEVDVMKAEQNTIQTQRTAITESVQFESYFTSDECKVLYRIIRDSDYANENFVSTSIDSPSERIDVMKELLEDAKNKVSEKSRPQLIFSVTADNLLALPNFKSFWDSFYPGNYMLVQYKDNTYVKLRMIGFTFNPCLPSSNSLEISFSNFLRSKAYYNDWAFFFEDSAGGGSGGGAGSSVGGGSGDGDYGESDDIDITISNTMLAKILNTELFGSRVTNVILDTMDLNSLLARTATFGSLASGTTKIDGKCITTGYIRDVYYNGTNGDIDNTAGSIINLETGKLSFGGGSLLFDGTDLTASGEIHATSGSFGFGNSRFIIGENNINGYHVKNIDVASLTFNDFTELKAYNILPINIEPVVTIELEQDIPDFVIPSTITDSIVIYQDNVYDVSLYINYAFTDHYYRIEYEYDANWNLIGTTTITLETNVSYETFQIRILPSDVTDFTYTFSNSGTKPTYTFSYTYPYTGSTFNSYILDTLAAVGISDTSSLTHRELDDDTQNVLYEDYHDTIVSQINCRIDTSIYYVLTTVENYVHIGTDYLEYVNLISTKDNILSTKDIHINGDINLQNGIISSNWRIYVEENNGFTLRVGDTESTRSITFLQYDNSTGSLLHSATLLDQNGKTTLPVELVVPKISSASGSLTFNSSVILSGGHNYVGATTVRGQRSLRFSNLSSSNRTYPHDCYLYGGNADSTTAIGMWDTRNDRSIIIYNDTSGGKITINGGSNTVISSTSLNVNSATINMNSSSVSNIWMKDWNGGSRRPCCSGTQNQTRIAYIYCNASNFCINGQHGSNSYSTKSIAITSSDIRLKTNIKNTEVTSALDLINDIKVRSFDWIDREENYHRKIGFIADELEQLDSQLATGGGYDEDGCMNVKSVDTFYLIGYVVKAIQELDKKLSDIQDELDEIKRM